MKRMSQSRIAEPKGSVSFCGALCVSLAIMVFAWGTSYKLSLYYAGHENSPAKVCTRGSDAAKSAVDHSVGGNTVVHTPLGIPDRFSPLQGAGDIPVDRLRDEAIIDRSPLSRAPILYLRPPPFDGLSLD